MSMAGYVRLYRKTQDHWIWQDAEKLRAWLDLILMAAWKPQSRLMGGKLIPIPRGGLAASERYLSDRWKWSTTKVRNFLRDLALDGMIKREKKQGLSVITLLNYESYNHSESEKKAPPEAAMEAEAKQTESEYNKGKNRRTEAHPSTTRDDLGDRVRRLLSFFNIDTPIERIGPEAQRIFVDPATAGFLDDEGLETINRKAPAWLAQAWIRDVNPRFIAERLADIYNYQPKEEITHAGGDKYAEGF